MKVSSALFLAFGNSFPQMPVICSSCLCRMTFTLCVAVYQGCVFFNQYLVVKFLGKGACGKVYLVMDTLDSKLYALKITQKSDFRTSKGKDKQASKNPLEDLRAEVAIMGRVAHPNMVCLKEVVDDPQRNKVLIVMNYAEGGPILPRKAIAQGMMLPEDMCRCGHPFCNSIHDS